MDYDAADRNGGCAAKFVAATVFDHRRNRAQIPVFIREAVFE